MLGGIIEGIHLSNLRLNLDIRDALIELGDKNSPDQTTGQTDKFDVDHAAQLVNQSTLALAVQENLSLNLK